MILDAFKRLRSGHRPRVLRHEHLPPAANRGAQGRDAHPARDRAGGRPVPDAARPRGAERAKASEQLTDSARSTSPRAGTDIVVNKEGRKAFGLWGATDQPGTWDHWPMGLVVVGGNRAGTNGRS